jgi:uncharacterized membrane protein YfcA
MSVAILCLFVTLGVVAVTFTAAWAMELSLDREWAWPGAFHLVVGFITDFLDALGIGSYATTTTIYRLKGAVADEKIPGTMNVGHCIPTFAQAFIYTTVLDVDPKTLVTLIAASVFGGWLGAGVVTRFSRRGVQAGMGVALLAAAGLILAKLLDWLPGGGDALGLEGPLYVVALTGNFLFGALMTIGIGAYAPIMIMVALLGMNPKTAFPIMMGSCAFLMPVCGYRFIRRDAYDARAALGLAIGGVPGVLVAAYLVKELPLEVVRWLVLVVVLYAATTLLLAAASITKAKGAPRVTECRSVDVSDLKSEIRDSKPVLDADLDQA